MTAEVRVVDSRHQSAGADGLTVDRFRTMVQDSHLSFLVGAGTPSSFFGRLGDIETVLSGLDALIGTPEAEKKLIRASIQGYFFERVLLPNRQLIPLHQDAAGVVTSYAKFLRTLNHILLRRRSSLLGKKANIGTAARIGDI